MYLPFFGIYNGNNQLELRGGRHRLEALIKLNNLSPINQKFLIIIFPKQASDLVCNNHFIKTKLYFTFHSKLTEMTIDNMLISELIMKLEGFGSTVVLNPSLISFPPFNNELLFKKWITTPLDVNWLDIKKYIWTNYNK